jgi:hypothetical protein
VQLGRILDRDHVIAAAPTIAELRYRRGGISQKALFVCGINPGSRYHARSVPRTDFVPLGINQGIEGSRVHQPFLDKQRFERLDSQAGIRRDRLVTRIMLVCLGEVVSSHFHSISKLG